MRYRIVSLLALVIILLDQLSKWAVNAYIPYGSAFSITSFFSLVHVKNYGAAFGFLNNPDTTWQFWFFFCTTLLAVGVLLFILRQAKKHETLLFYALGFILGGAIGNFIDRVRFQAVTDFLDFYIHVWHWPSFNVADIAICLGAGLLFFHTLTCKEKG